ncbi:hypothetical protein LOD99_8453 [Oopsacas minuta]|uniref:Uncharacterized protein n=1 Tax=Oopsacas minuta TaxID=111878 RepID=A0AAV7JGD1_9METZ|nr:hypothetical protein LOD99_8453 [Oopsacas minuta]
MRTTRDMKKWKLICVSKVAVILSESKDMDLKNPQLIESMPFGEMTGKPHSSLIHKLTSNLLKSKLAEIRVFHVFNMRQHREPIPIGHYTSRDICIFIIETVLP